MSDAWVVFDLGFGDAGKGSITDFLVRDLGAQLVVRFNGGAQAGHNVVTEDGRHHTFSQFCAGTFAGARGLLGPDFLLHPLGMAVEAEHLQCKGVPDPWALTQVDRRARVITPYQQAAGRVRERLRGEAAHGTCGVGIGECAGDALAHPEDTLHAGDLTDARTVRARLASQRERKLEELRALGADPRAHEDLALFEDPGLIDRVVEAWREVGSKLQLLSPEQTLSTIARAPRVIFEGAQGVLLDEHWGFHPHTTWSDCTPAGALALLGDRPCTRLGLTRAYMVRHGAGPFPTEDDAALPELHNDSTGWQGRFRVGPLDLVLLRYAAQVSSPDALAVTCLDRVPSPRLCSSYRGEAPPALARSEGGRIFELVPGPREDLSHRERLGQWLRSIVPEVTPGEPVSALQDVLGVPVWLESWGPGPDAKRWKR